MKVSVKETETAVIASIEGSIDSKTAPDLQQSILPVVNDRNLMVLDLTAVSFVSSAGLRVLLMVYRQLKSNNGKVVLVGVSEEIMDVMFMTGFITFFEIAPTLKEAFANN
ncbi:STAS domain-containing protein [Mucilaginibacter aquatilis]|uniref:Anti-sigma factor antagonist n=1 Tax=Mucilaginibacter aquatilis TaxID=1517760 RepID=A0A6I4I7Y6_9SPHI|nr:STAS domain-containing protein [Mucilaginibacter aquatilis]MVN91231.1 anti-sigma factor antagonist [Mucilaginibacter aquatilis]